MTIPRSYILLQYLVDQPAEEVATTKATPSPAIVPLGCGSPTSGAMTTIHYGVHDRGAIQLVIVDMFGRTVARLVDDQKDRGVCEAMLDVSSLSPGRSLPKVTMDDAPGLSIAKTMTVMK